jgi:hypothetical protein
LNVSEITPAALPAMPPQPDAPPPDEFRDALLTYAPAVLVAFVLNWTLTTQRGWATRQALVASVAVGIVLAVLLQRALARRGGAGR